MVDVCIRVPRKGRFNVEEAFLSVGELSGC